MNDHVKYVVVEESVIPKDAAEPCEDKVVICDDYVAVIDGATSKTDVRWEGRTTGQVAVELLANVIEELEPSVTFVDAIQALTLAIHDFYLSNGVIERVAKRPNERLTASLALFSNARREVWLIGDCQVLVNEQYFTVRKEVDELLAGLRAIYTELARLEGVSEQVIQQQDPGREAILDLLRRQPGFQNNRQSAFSYAVVDGFPVQHADVTRVAISSGDQLVLATDGYPLLSPTLAESEASLSKILDEDPTLTKGYRATKGLRSGCNSFDDRAYVRIKVL